VSTEQQTTVEQRQALRQRYDLEMHPSCRQCGGEMVNTRIDLNDGTLRWRCPRDERIRYTSSSAAEILAAVADADALPAALAEVERLREAFAKAREREDNLAVAVTESHDAHDRDKRALRRQQSALEWYAAPVRYLSRWPVKTEVAEDGGILRNQELEAKRQKAWERIFPPEVPSP
jgi:hypothetical protein